MIPENIAKDLKHIRSQIKAANTLIDNWVVKGNSLLFKDITGQLEGALGNITSLLVFIDNV